MQDAVAHSQRVASLTETVLAAQKDVDAIKLDHNLEGIDGRILGEAMVIRLAKAQAVQAAAVATQRVTEGKLSEVEKSNQRSSDTMGDLRSQLSAANDAVVSLRSQLAAAEAQGEKLRLIKSMERTCLERATSALLAASACYVCSLCLLAASACCVCSLRAAHCVCSALRAALLVGSAR